MSLIVDNLSVQLFSKRRTLQVLDRVSFALEKGKTLGIVGESGCGKSMTALSIMRLVPSPPLQEMNGQIQWNGKNVLQCSKREMRKIRGKEISMIFQEPMTSLNPVLSVGDQIREILKEHESFSRKEQIERSIALLSKVGIPSPEQRVNEYPHQLSGGMRQRVMIAMALACNPHLLIADEPTTALDVTIQAQILEQLRLLQEESEMGMIFISHDLDVVGYVADQVAVMYAGEIVEMAPVDQIFSNPQHPYTEALHKARPHGQRNEKLSAIVGNVPALDNLPMGCRFYDRCEFRTEQCQASRPALKQIKSDHAVRCFER